MENKDYLYSDLPKRRKDVLKNLIKYRKGTLLEILLLSIFFTVPLFFFLIYTRYFYVSLDKTEPITYVLMNTLPGMFLTFLYGAGLSGIFYTLRRLIFSDTVRLPYHFFKGIKESGFEFGLFVTIFYILYSLLDIVDKVILRNNPSLYPMVTIIIFIIDIFLFYILFYVLSSASLYVVSFLQAFKDAFRNAFKNFRVSFMQYLIGFLPLLLLYPYSNSSFLYMNIAGAVLMVFYSITGPFTNLPVAYNLFDESINKESYPDYYKKGMFKE